MGVRGVNGYAVPRCTWVCAGVFVDEFSEYLLETKVLTSADFNTYPIRIFLDLFYIALIELFQFFGLVTYYMCKYTKYGTL